MSPSHELDEALAVLRRREPAARIAVAGASNNPSKYGNIIVRNLMGKGYTVLPVNPREEVVAGLPAARSLDQLPPPVDILVCVTPPAVTRTLLEQAARLSLPLVWLQEGSFDDSVLELARAAPFRTVHTTCIMVASNF